MHLNQATPEEMTYITAGLISTLEFTPSTSHPEACLPIAERIAELYARRFAHGEWVYPEFDRMRPADVAAGMRREAEERVAAAFEPEEA